MPDSQWSVGSGQSAVGSGQWAAASQDGAVSHTLGAPVGRPGAPPTGASAFTPASGRPVTVQEFQQP
jgi:hypothetical protein